MKGVGGNDGMRGRVPSWLVRRGPAMVALMAYLGWSGVGAVREQRTLQGKIDAARASAPRPADIEAERVRAVELARELDEARGGLATLRGDLARLGGTWTNAVARLAGAEELAALWGRHGLRLEEQALVTGDASLPPTLQQLVDRARAVMGKGRHPVAWEVRLRGGYMGMLGALEELAVAEVAVVPLSLAMRALEGSDDKEWRLRLWQ